MTENVISTLRSSLSRGSLSNAPWYSTPSSVMVMSPVPSDLSSFHVPVLSPVTLPSSVSVMFTGLLTPR